MKPNEIQQIIIDLVNEYDEHGYVLTSEILHKYEHEINKLMDTKEE